MRQRVIALVEAGYGARSACRLIGVPGSKAARRPEIEIINWPSKSPDLNVIENLQAELKKRIATYAHRSSRSRDELWDQVVDTWEDLAGDQNLFHNLVTSMPDRLRAVIEADGIYFENNAKMILEDKEYHFDCSRKRKRSNLLNDYEYTVPENFRINTFLEVTLKYIEVKSEKSELPSDAASSQSQTKSPDTDIQKTVPQENSSQIPINQPMAVRSSSSETGSVGVQHLSKDSKESSKEDVPSSERGLESQKDESSNKSILISEQESKSEEAFVEKPIVKEEKKENSQKPAFHVAQNSELPKSSAEQNLEEEKNDRMKSQQLDNKEIKKQKERVSILEGQSTDRTTEELPSDLRDISASGADKSDVIQEDNLQSCGNKEKQSREPSLERVHRLPVQHQEHEEGFHTRCNGGNGILGSYQGHYVCDDIAIHFNNDPKPLDKILYTPLSWRPQPPPPPLFDEDDEDDDWLS
ncbi:hypothetical protein ANN_26259 [Periplaneta americana]|uniref:Uncharacterized protein n=1 Tax=Periplaneta americana TaxID=6978 RepID=A0ABQ8S5W3_PERAM|nr:hypothetical protein ANN_26259 [Periplaneta americana]